MVDNLKTIEMSEIDKYRLQALVARKDQCESRIALLELQHDKMADRLLMANTEFEAWKQDFEARILKVHGLSINQVNIDVENGRVIPAKS